MLFDPHLLRFCIGEYEEERGVAGIRDPQFATVDHKVIAVLYKPV